MSPDVGRGAFACSGLFPFTGDVLGTLSERRARWCRESIAGCRELAHRIVASRPTRLILAPAHAERVGGAFRVSSGERLAGALEYGTARVEVDLPGEVELPAVLRDEARSHSVIVVELERVPLEESALVPLALLAGAGWDGPTIWVAPPRRTGREELAIFGRALERACAVVGGRTSLVASGHGSSRLKPGTRGYHPEAVVFDESVREAVAAADLAAIASIDPGLRELAAESLVDSSTLICSALRSPRGSEVCSYESPFGTGLLAAVYHRGDE